MKLGIYLNSQHPAGDDPARRFAETLEQARLIRSLGFDSIWAGEHHVTPGFHYLPAAADAAAPGRRGPTGCGRHQRGAAAAAQPGRDRRGRRLPRRDHRRALPARRRARLSPGGVRDLRRADGGAGEPAQGGRRDHPPAVDRGQGHPPRPALDARATPRSARARSSRRAPPILVGSQVPAGIARAARIADGWLVVPLPRVDEFAASGAFAAARAAAEGLPPSPHICRLLEVVCAPDEETAFRRAAPYLLDKYAAYFSWGLEGLTLDPKAPPEAAVPRPRGQPLRDRLAGPGHRRAAGPARGRRHPPDDARELARACRRPTCSPASSCWAARCCPRSGGACGAA